MNHLVRASLPVAGLLVLAGCYHATIETGRAPSPQVIEEKFASSWVYGLVPPETIETASRCPNGVARVETHLSFVNQLVGFLTLGIYTPMNIRVTCAASDEDADAEQAIPAEATEADVQRAFSDAAKTAVDTGGPVYIRFHQP